MPTEPIKRAPFWLVTRTIYMNRRASLLTVASAPCLWTQTTDKPAPVKPLPDRGPRQDLDLVKAFVQAGHGDQNIPRVKEYLARDPQLVFASWDWGGGDWETALAGASHMGARQMARFLLSQGARIDSFCAAMLGQRRVVAALIEADPAVAQARGPHGLSLLYHVAISGDVAMAELVKPHLAQREDSFNQALSAAVRDGHLAMTKWLFDNAAIDPNREDSMGRRPLTVARQKGFDEVAAELRKRGAREAQ